MYSSVVIQANQFPSNVQATPDSRQLQDLLLIHHHDLYVQASSAAAHGVLSLNMGLISSYVSHTCTIQHLSGALQGGTSVPAPVPWLLICAQCLLQQPGKAPHCQRSTPSQQDLLACGQILLLLLVASPMVAARVLTVVVRTVLLVVFRVKGPTLVAAVMLLCAGAAGLAACLGSALLAVGLTVWHACRQLQGLHDASHQEVRLELVAPERLPRVWAVEATIARAALDAGAAVGVTSGGHHGILECAIAYGAVQL